MFEKIVLRRSVDGPTITFGEIAEALLFYQSIHLVLDYQSFMSLVKSIGMQNLLQLITLPDVKVTYIDEIPAINTEQSIYGAV